MNNLPTAKIEEYKDRANVWNALAQSLSIIDDSSYDFASSQASAIKKATDSIEEQRKAITEPLNKSLKETNALFKNIAQPFVSALDIYRLKMKEYQTAKIAADQAARDKIAAKVETGYIRPDTAAAKLDALPTVEKSNENSQARTIMKYRVVDKSRVPLDFMEVDMVAVRKSFLAGNPVAGCEAYEEISIALK